MLFKWNIVKAMSSYTLEYQSTCSVLQFAREKVRAKGVTVKRITEEKAHRDLKHKETEAKAIEELSFINQTLSPIHFRHISINYHTKGSMHHL